MSHDSSSLDVIEAVWEGKNILIATSEREGDGCVEAAVQAVMTCAKEIGIVLDAVANAVINIGASKNTTLAAVGEGMNHLYKSCPNAHVSYSHSFPFADSDRTRITVILPL